MTSKWVALQVFAASLALMATAISYQLLAKHLSGSTGPAWFDAGCSDEPESRANCAAVLASPYSYFPARTDENKDIKNPLPVAFLGMVYYSMLATWLIFVGRPSPQRWKYHLVPVVLVATGLMASAYYMYIMFAQLDQWCPWCLVTHVLNALIALSLFLMWPSQSAEEKTRTQESSKKSKKPADPPVRAAHPSTRLGWTCIFLMAAVAFGENMFLQAAKGYSRAEQLAHERDYYRTEILRIKGDGATLYDRWRTSEKLDMTMDGTETFRTYARKSEDVLPVVVFSDFQCPSCRNTAEFLEKQVQGLFAGNLAIVFKHYPLDDECNNRTKGQTHPMACEASRWVEAARLVSGNPGFWQVHDILFENQKDLASGLISNDSIAEALKIPVDKLTEALASSEIEDRIKKDVREAGRLNVHGTPSVYVMSRKVDSLAVRELTFWDRVADVYWESRKTPRPEETKLRLKEKAPSAPTKATQDNPDQPAAP